MKKLQIPDLQNRINAEEIERARWQDTASFNILHRRKKEFGEASEAMVEYYFVISVTIFNRCNAGKVDNDDHHHNEEEEEDVAVRRMLWLINLLNVFRISVPVGH